MNSSFKNLVKYRNRALEDILEKANSRFESLLNSQLEAWGSKYPRHSFKAIGGSSYLLSIKVAPSVMGKTTIDEIPEHLRRGAVGELCKQVEYIRELYHNTDFNISLSYGSSPNYFEE